MQVVDSNTHLIDTALGPVAVTVSTVQNYDIDDYVHTTVRAQAIKLQLSNALSSVDTRLTKNRPPVKVDDKSVGGY